MSQFSTSTSKHLTPIGMCLKSRRVVSLDSSSYAENAIEKSDLRNRPVFKSLKSQSFSDGQANFMVPLSFEEVDLKSTPLSSLRSCSEFQRNQSNSAFLKKMEGSEKKSTYKKISGFISGIFSYRHSGSSGHSQSRRGEDDERMYFVQNMTSRGDDILYDDDSDTVIEAKDVKKNTSTKSSPRREKISPVKAMHRRSIEDTLNDEKEHGKLRRKRSVDTGNNLSVMYETSAALDLLFGYRPDMGPRGPMEIELKTLKSFSTEAPDRANISDHNLQEAPDENLNPWHLRLPRLPSHDALSEYGSSRSTRSASIVSTDVYQQFRFGQVTTWTPLIIHTHNRVIDYGRVVLRDNRADEMYYEMLRLQPFAFGSYLRGLLWAGYSSLFFTAYSLYSWPNQVPVTCVWQSVLSTIFYAYLVIQFLINLVQLPVRMSLHLQCWQSTPTLDVEAALGVLRGMIQSDAWILNRLLGRFLDVLSIIAVIAGESYLQLFPLFEKAGFAGGAPYSPAANDALRAIVVSILATCMYSFVVRIIVCTVFSLSCHDPHVLSEARRRGLSALDIETLPTFVFSDSDDVNNHDCSICLCSFDRGDMLISLPCSQKHSFHACCIRQWLQRQNSCPLCQRVV